MESTTLKIRLVFGNGVLRKTQKKDGLTRSWVLLKPHFDTISDLVSYIFHSFQLHRNCPHGIFLSMDGFVLPEFESTSILKDKDLVSVKRKGSRMLRAYKAIEEPKTYIGDEIVEKQTLASNVRLLANEEFNRTENNESEDEDETAKSKLCVQDAPNGDVSSKKRKASSKLPSPKKKRKLLVDTDPKKHLHDCKQITKPSKKRKHDNKCNQNAVSGPDVKEKCTADLNQESNSESELSGNTNDSTEVSPKPDKHKKVSRSTLRKRSKRLLKRLQREKSKMEEGDGQQPVKDVITDTGSKKDMVSNLVEQNNEGSDAGSDAEGDLVPVVIRPGLIRYLPPGKAKDIQENQEANALDVPSTQNGLSEEHPTTKNVLDAKNKQVAKEAYCWNGITNKRKGQKWGQESSTWEESNTSWKDSRDVNGHSSNTWTARNQPASSWQESKEDNGQPNNKCTDKKHQSSNKSINFDKLVPLVDLPKTGDVVAYRFLELSSSWCPELSSFRVGKITSFEPDSKKIMLDPVPEYPLNLERNDDDDDDEQPLGFSAYNEDGSLETDLSSLNDMRIIKISGLTQSEAAKSDATKIAATNGSSAPSTSQKDKATQAPKSDASKIAATNGSSAPSTSQKDKATTQDVKQVASEVINSANGKNDVWEEISEAVSAKKAQLMQEDNWTKKETPAKRPWSYRSLRSSAIGPIMARLREQNGV